MKRVLDKAIIVAGVTALLVCLYFMFGAGIGYKSLTEEDAVRIMENDPDCLIVDVRTQTEYDNGHIPGAVCVPIEEIRAGKTDALPDKYQTLLLYCHTGRRAADAAKILASMDYRNVYEFGGLVDWKGPLTDPLPVEDADAEPSGTDSAAPDTEASAENAVPATKASAESAAGTN